MTAKRKVYCLNPDCPHEKLLKFSDWIRINLPDSCFGFWVTNLDFIFYNKGTKRTAFVEQKTNGLYVPDYQNEIFNQYKNWINNGIDSGWEFLGYHRIRFENNFFNDGKVFLDGKESNENEIRKYLSSI